MGPSLSVTPGKGYTVNKLFLWGQLHSTHCFGQEIPIVHLNHAVSSRNCQKSSVLTPEDPQENPSVGNAKETVKTYFLQTVKFEYLDVFCKVMSLYLTPPVILYIPRKRVPVRWTEPITREGGESEVLE